MEENVKGFKDYLNVYEFECVLPGSGETVKFKPITTGQLKRLLVYENENNPAVIEDALDELITSSVTTEGFNIEDLYLQDRFFLLIEIRKQTKGEKYQFTYNCNHPIQGSDGKTTICNSQTIQNVDLAKLEIKPFRDDIDNIVQVNPSVSVTLKHIKRGQQKEAYRHVNPNNMSETQLVSEMSLLTHAAGIDVIYYPDGENRVASIHDKKFLLESVPTTSYDLIRNWFNENDFGTVFTIESICISCGHKLDIPIPVDNFFF
jgi:hypothetical protein